MLETTSTRAGQVKGKYPLPHKNAVLLSCMDARLVNEMTAFMERDNMTNRYDHLILAGAGLGLMHGKTDKKFACWSDSFFLHLGIALELRRPADIYIVEHRNCGAYRELIGEDFEDDDESQKEERRSHRGYAKLAAKRIQAWCRKFKLQDGTVINPRVNTFLMDLRGDIEHLDTIAARGKKKS